MNMNPIVSVIMPVYNLEKYVAQAIDSVLNQTFENFEFIIINDGSSDSTASIVQSYNDKRIVFVDNKINKKKSACLNEGISIARGKYFVMMDGDDISLPNRIECLYNYMESHPGILACGSHIRKFGDVETNTCKWPSKYEDIYLGLLSNCCVNFPIVNLELYKNAHLSFDENFLAEDYLMWIKMVNVGIVEALPIILYEYRIHGEQISQVNLNNINRYVLLEKNLHFSNMYLKTIGKKYKGEPFWVNRPLAYKELIDRMDIMCFLFEGNKKTRVFDQSVFEYSLSRIWYRLFVQSDLSFSEYMKAFSESKSLRRKANLGVKNYCYITYKLLVNIL